MQYGLIINVINYLFTPESSGHKPCHSLISSREDKGPKIKLVDSLLQHRFGPEAKPEKASFH